MSIAPAIASSLLSTSFSASIKSSEILSILSFGFCARIISASGASPFSFAIVALVRRFGLNGRYISSSSDNVTAFSIDFAISTVKFSCSSIKRNISSFLSSISSTITVNPLSKKAHSCILSQIVVNEKVVDENIVSSGINLTFVPVLLVLPKRCNGISNFPPSLNLIKCS